MYLYICMCTDIYMWVFIIPLCIARFLPDLPITFSPVLHLAAVKLSPAVCCLIYNVSVRIVESDLDENWAIDSKGPYEFV